MVALGGLLQDGQLRPLSPRLTRFRTVTIERLHDRRYVRLAKETANHRKYIFALTVHGLTRARAALAPMTCEPRP